MSVPAFFCSAAAKGGFTVRHIRYTTGRRSRVKHSTGIELETRTPRKVRGVKHSTGRASRVVHSTGPALDSTEEREQDAE